MTAAANYRYIVKFSTATWTVLDTYYLYYTMCIMPWLKIESMHSWNIEYRLQTSTIKYNYYQWQVFKKADGYLIVANCSNCTVNCGTL